MLPSETRTLCVCRMQYITWKECIHVRSQIPCTATAYTAYSRSQITQFRDFHLAPRWNSNRWPLIIQVQFKQFPEIITHKRDHLGRESTREGHNNGSLNGSDDKISRSEANMCDQLLFCGKLVLWLIAGVSTDVLFFFCFPNFNHLFFAICH